MNMREQLLKEHSKRQTEKIANYVRASASRFNQLAKLFLAGEYRVTQRAAWVVSLCAERNPQLILPHLAKFIAFAENPPHVAVKRNVLRVMLFVEIPQELEGKAYDLCYTLARQAKEDIAVRCYAMSVITTLALKYPELKPEVCDLLQSTKGYDSAGLRSRTRKLSNLLKC